MPTRRSRPGGQTGAFDREFDPRSRRATQQPGRGRTASHTDTPAEEPVGKAREGKEQDGEVMEYGAYDPQNGERQVEELEHVVVAPPERGQRGHRQCEQDDKG